MFWLALLAIFLALPAQAVTYARQQPIGLGSKRVYPNVRQPTPEAYYHVSLDNWGTVAYCDGSYWPYTLFPGARASSSLLDFNKFTAGLPGGIFLANAAAQLIDVFANPNTYNNAFAAVWDSSEPGAYSVINLDNNQQVRGSSYPTVPIWVPRKASVDAWVAFHDTTTMDVPWDGIYIDECTAEFPAFRINEIKAVTSHFDIDGDGVADDSLKIVTQYRQWRPYLTAQLRAALGTNKIIMANAAGALDDPALNGIAIEKVGNAGKPDSTSAIAIMRSQKAVSVMPFYGVVWDTAGRTLSALAVVRAVPGVYYGVSSSNVHSLP